jgi:hypothetical protein
MTSEPEFSIAEITRHLGEIALTGELGETQARSLRIAAYALLFIERRELLRELELFVEEAEGPLRLEQVASLRRMGIAPRDDDVNS